MLVYRKKKRRKHSHIYWIYRKSELSTVEFNIVNYGWMAEVSPKNFHFPNFTVWYSFLLFFFNRCANKVSNSETIEWPPPWWINIRQFIYRMTSYISRASNKRTEMLLAQMWMMLRCCLNVIRFCLHEINPKTINYNIETLEISRYFIFVFFGYCSDFMSEFYIDSNIRKSVSVNANENNREWPRKWMCVNRFGRDCALNE